MTIHRLLDVADALQFKGSIDAAANPNYPAAEAGHVYRISVAGKVGGASGVNVESGDTLTCNVDSSASGDHATVGANWSITQGNIDGAVIGPATAVDENLALFDTASGKVIKDGAMGRRNLVTSIPAAGVGGTANAITLTLTGGVALGDGLTLCFQPEAANTGDVTINYNAGGAIQLLGTDGAALKAAALNIVVPIIVRYDAAAAKWRLVSGDSSFDELVISVTDRAYGAKGDLKRVLDATIVIGTSATTVLSASNPWTAEDVGKEFLIRGAGVAGVVHKTTIAAWNNPGSIEIADAASMSVTTEAIWATDDSAAIQAAWDASYAARRDDNWKFAVPPAVYLKPGFYLCKTGLVIQGDHNNFMVAGAGLASQIGTWEDIVLIRANDDCRSTGWPASDADDATPFDAAGVATLLGLSISNLSLVNLDPDTVNSCALLLSRVANSTFSYLDTKDWALHVDMHGCNRPDFLKCDMKGNGRNAANPARALWRTLGLHDSGGDQAGGGIRFTSCDFEGNSAAAGSHPYGGLIHSADTVYITGSSHIKGCAVNICTNMRNTPQSKTIIDIQLDKFYWDDVDPDGIDLHITGVAGAGCDYRRFFLTEPYLRGSNNADYAVRINVANAGDFDGDFGDFRVNGGIVRRYEICAFLIQGAASGYLNCNGVSLDGTLIEENRTDAVGGTSAINVEWTGHLNISDITFGPDLNAASRAMNINVTGLTAGTYSASITDNSFINHNYSSEYMALTGSNNDPAIVIRNNTKKSGDDNIYLFEADASGAIEDISGYAGDAQWSDNTNNPEAAFTGYFKRDGDWCHVVLNVAFSSRGTPTSETATTLILKDVVPYLSKTFGAHFPLVIEPSANFGDATDAATPSDDNIVFSHMIARQLQNTKDIVPRQRADNGKNMANIRAENITATTAFVVSGSYPIA